MKLTRYNETGCVSYMMQQDDGEWVPWEEVLALQKENESLKAKLAERSAQHEADYAARDRLASIP